MSVDRVDNIKDAPEKVLSRVIGHGSDGKGGAATLENLKEQLAITAADVSGAVPDTRQVATENGIQGGGFLDGDMTLSLTDTGISAGAYGSASAVPVITVDAKGRVTAAEEVEVEVPASGVGAGTYGSATEIPVITVGADGRVTAAEEVEVEVPASGVGAGTYGSATEIPVITVGADGRVTAVTTAVAAGVRSYTIMAHQIAAAIGTATAATLSGSGVIHPAPCLDYDASSYEYARVFLPVPKAWDLDAIDLRLGWAPADGNSGDVVWAVRAVVINADDASSNLALDFGGVASATSAAPGAVTEMQTALISNCVPAGTPEDGSLLALLIARSAPNVADTYAADARLVFVEVLFGVTSNSDG